MRFATLPVPDLSPLQSLEQRRQRGLQEVASLEALLAQRPLLGFEARSLQRSSSLVREMDDQIGMLLATEPAHSPMGVGGSRQHSCDPTPLDPTGPSASVKAPPAEAAKAIR